jgi:FAD/FMN-containing dehydrogenase
VGLEVVLPSGEVVRTGSASNPAASSFERYCLGPDLTGLFIGSGGTLGAITEATLKISRMPQAEGLYCYGFGKYETGVTAVSRLQKERLTNNMVLVSGCLPTNGECMLHIVTRGTANRVQENGRAIKELCEKQGGTKIDSHSTSKFWKTHQYSWLRQQSPETWDKKRHWAETGGYVSLPQLLKCYGAFRKYLRDFSIEKEKVLLETFDVYVTRNAAFLWIDILYDESDVESWQNAIKVRNKLDEIMFSLGLCPVRVNGSIFPKYMESLRSRPLLYSLKKALDPKNILNPMIF